jgi:hypothetical protein
LKNIRKCLKKLLFSDIAAQEVSKVEELKIIVKGDQCR